MRRLVILISVFFLSASVYSQEVDATRLPAVKRVIDKAEATIRRNRKAYDEANQEALAEAEAELIKEVDRLSKAGKPEEAVAVKKLAGGIKAELVASAEKATALPNPAQQGAVAWNKHKYKYIADKLSWPDAKRKCEDMGGHLVIIDDRAEQDFVVQLLARFSREPQYASWLGITCQEKPGQWQTVAGDKVTYQNWHAGEPNGPDSPFGALAMHFGGQWDDVPSHHVFAFVCEWDE